MSEKKKEKKKKKGGGGEEEEEQKQEESGGWDEVPWFCGKNCNRSAPSTCPAVVVISRAAKPLFRSVYGICANRKITMVALKPWIFTHSHLEQVTRTGHLWNKLPHSIKVHFSFATGANADIMVFVGGGQDVWRAPGGKSRSSDFDRGVLLFEFPA